MKKLVKVNNSTIYLVILSGISLFTLLKSSGELENTSYQWVNNSFQKFSFTNNIIYNFSTGFLISVIFYIVVVVVPSHRKRHIIKKHLNGVYRVFKENCIHLFLSASKTTAQSKTVNDLLSQKDFKVFFKEEISSSQNRWHSVANGLDEYHLGQLLLEYEFLLNEITYVLNNVDIEDKDVFLFFKRLSSAVYHLKNIKPEYDDVKQIMAFNWEIFSGWSWLEGYREEDIVEYMMEKI